MEDPDAMREAVKASLTLRTKRFRQTEEQLQIATHALSQAFETIFAEPNLAMQKFSEIVQSRGLSAAIGRFRSKPIDIVPAWKVLRGKYDMRHGANREREHAQEWIERLPGLYRELEAAQNAHDLSIRLVEDAQSQLRKQEEGEDPDVALRPIRKLGQSRRHVPK